MGGMEKTCPCHHPASLLMPNGDPLGLFLICDCYLSCSFSFYTLTISCQLTCLQSTQYFHVFIDHLTLSYLFVIDQQIWNKFEDGILSCFQQSFLNKIIVNMMLVEHRNGVVRSRKTVANSAFKHLVSVLTETSF